MSATVCSAKKKSLVRGHKEKFESIHQRELLSSKTTCISMPAPAFSFVQGKWLKCRQSCVTIRPTLRASIRGELLIIPSEHHYGQNLGPGQFVTLILQIPPIRPGPNWRVDQIKTQDKTWLNWRQEPIQKLLWASAQYLALPKEHFVNSLDLKWRAHTMTPCRLR